MPVQKKKTKSLSVSSFALLLVVLKWHRGSEGVKGFKFAPLLVVFKRHHGSEGVNVSFTVKGKVRRAKHIKGSKERYLLGQKHSLQISR